ncbi:hypothetical protein BV22DRAFT_978092, partial [Leucogyrophana mollusca]
DDASQTDPVAAAQRSKRRIQALEAEVEALREGSKKRRADASTTVNRGRLLRRVVSLFDHVPDLIRENDRREALADDMLGDDQEEEDAFVPERLYRGYLRLVQYLPWMKEKLATADPLDLQVIYKELRKGADGARGDDTASLKGVVVTWLTEMFHPVEPALTAHNKTDRGLQHDVTGRLLCPIDYDWDSDEIKTQVRERHPDYLVTADSFPRFLYDTTKAYDPFNVENGLFKSTLLLRTFMFLFTSPTSAQGASAEDAQPGQHADRTSTRSHLRFALSSVSTWRGTDGDFDYEEFYNIIVEFFEAPPSRGAEHRVKELLLWWDRKVFGRQRVMAVPDARCVSLSVARLAAQRLA